MTDDDQVWGSRLVDVRIRSHGRDRVRAELEFEIGAGAAGDHCSAPVATDSEVVAAVGEWLFPIPNRSLGMDAVQATQNFLMMPHGVQVRFMAHALQAMAATSRCIQEDHDGAVQALGQIFAMAGSKPIPTDVAGRFLAGQMSHEEQRQHGLRRRRVTMSVCPECLAGKCGNCTDLALDPETDDLVQCSCPSLVHPRNPNPNPTP